MAIVCSATLAHAQPMPNTEKYLEDAFTKSKAVTATLSIRREGKKLFADVRYENKLDRSICVHERNLGWFEKTPIYVMIRDQNGRALKNKTWINNYETGARSAEPILPISPTRITSYLFHSCIEFPKGFVFTIRYSLLENFEFPKTKASYTAFYRGPGFPYYDPPEDEVRVWLRSDPVSFELDNRSLLKKLFD